MNLGTLALPNLFHYVLIGVLRSMCIVEENEEEILFKIKKNINGVEKVNTSILMDKETLLNEEVKNIET